MPNQTKAKPIVHWEMIEDKHKFVAIGGDSRPFAYTHRPIPSKYYDHWYRTEGYIACLVSTKIVSNPDNFPWDETLVERPE